MGAAQCQSWAEAKWVSCCPLLVAPGEEELCWGLSATNLKPQLFHVAYVLIKFANSPRPDLWVLERSTDFGLTYEPWQYFASSKRDCIEKFGLQTVDRITKDDHAICTTEYSRIVPLENGEIVVSLVNGRPGAMNFSYSPLLRNFTKATNIRLRFLQTNTLLGHLMGKALRDPTVTRRYYYSIKDISIGGRCVCHGHADVCDAKDPNDPYRTPLLHSLLDAFGIFALGPKPCSNVAAHVQQQLLHFTQSRSHLGGENISYLGASYSQHITSAKPFGIQQDKDADTTSRRGDNRSPAAAPVPDAEDNQEDNGSLAAQKQVCRRSRMLSLLDPAR
ncbi:laminin subunit hypothetical protein [Limosa lapponica baueri]|uniref:Laminin N-terminal domain-containing protein n=1 Tax=Limosa lapponica baueri TaxID=1758121 RepID=A0A2I0T8K9_LIMLA|nr:laminin subunit hypothetical protein [Limosa lapponica baueri]